MYSCVVLFVQECEVCPGMKSNAILTNSKISSNITLRNATEKEFDEIVTSSDIDHQLPRNSFNEDDSSLPLSFSTIIKQAKATDNVVVEAILCINQYGFIDQGKLKGVRKQLRIENGLLTKSGRPFVPQRLR